MLHALQLEYDGQSTDKLAGDLRRDVPIFVALRAIQDSGVDELIYSKARDQIIDRLKQALDSRDLCLTTSLHLLGRLFSFSELIGEFLGTHPSTVSMMDALNSLGALGAMPEAKNPILNACVASLRCGLHFANSVLQCPCGCCECCSRRVCIAFLCSNSVGARTSANQISR